MKLFKVFTIAAEPFQPEILGGVIWQLNISGVIEEENSLKVYVEDENINEASVNSLLENLVIEKVIENFKVTSEIFENKNWNKLWEKGREIIRITDRIIIKPSFKNYLPKNSEIILTIDPKMSFGTGEHQTTKLMLSLLEKYIRPGSKVLDLGSGTGILAIASIKLGASKAFAIDNDETCYENCKENCAINDVAVSVEVLTGIVDDVKENNFDVVLANIQKNVLLDIVNKIKTKLSKNGLLILSGLLKEDEYQIEQRYHLLGFKTEEVKSMDEWIAVVFSLK
jgi:ribosomal protein L11 methyltransferase